MKQKSIILLTAMLLSITGMANIHRSAANPKPVKKTLISFAVEANCGQCKDRIENALNKKGVYKAVFKLDSKILTVTYDPRKLEEIQLHNMVAMVGHDTEKVKASNVVYESLPDCCKYRQDDDEWGPHQH
ncbi:MAG: cation transporter [Bacteroidetes bacterium]|nr:cation transporter [Bacteroidota bacterium]